MKRKITQSVDRHLPFPEEGPGPGAGFGGNGPPVERVALLRQLSEADRELLNRTVQARVSRSATIQAAAAETSRPVDRSQWLNFENLLGAAEQRMLRSAAAAIGLRDPYFLVHEADAGASTVVVGRTMHNFSSYDYLGFNHHSAVRAAAKSAIDRYGVSASASRLVAGERPVHRDLEAALAAHYQTQACISFVSGHAANVATIGSLLGPKDLIIHDALAHNSIVAGAQMSRAERRSFPHNDLAVLEAMLATLRPQYERVLIVAEGLYSMDGDVCDLPGLIAVKERHQTWLMIDDAHGLGVLGAPGQGIFEHHGVDPAHVDIWMGTLSKTLSGCGGYIAGPQTLIDFLKRAAGGFVYSVARPPGIAAASLESLRLLRQEPHRVEKLRANAKLFARLARSAGLDIGASIGEAIIPVMAGGSIRAVSASQRLFDLGVNVQPIIYPAIPERLARLRFFLSSEHSFEQIELVVPMIAKEVAATNATSLTGFIKDLQKS